MDTNLWKIPCNIPIEYRESVIRILKTSLEAVDPFLAVKKAILRRKDGFSINGKEFYLYPDTKIKVVSFGKAAVSMTRGFVEVFEDKIQSGVVVTKNLPLEEILSCEKFQVIKSSHPFPDEKSVLAAETVINFLKDTRDEDIVFFLISGGGSALLTAPEDDLRLEQVQKLTQMLLASGATIQEMNVIRKHLDKVKGGKLALATYPARFISLVISDVTNNALDTIASGPTAVDTSTFDDAINILQKYMLWEGIPREIQIYLEAGVKGSQPETVKKGHPVWEKGYNQIIASNATAMHAAKEQAIIEGFSAYVNEAPFIGEAQEVGRYLVHQAREQWKEQLQSSQRACIIFGGETTVTLKGNGKGGRNQEVALGAAKALAGSTNEVVITLATDGEDGPTDAAGACVNGFTFQDAKRLHLDIDEALDSNNAFPLLEKSGLLVKTGPTGTNVNDLAFWFSY